MSYAAPATNRINEIMATDDVLSLSKALPSLKADFDARDINGRTVLYNAVVANATDCALFLLDNGFKNVDLADNQGETPLMRAAFNGNTTLTSALVAKGASLETRSRSGGTPLHFAYASSSKSDDIVKLLVDAGASTEALDSQGAPPQSWSSQAAAREAGAELLKRKPPRSILTRKKP